MSEQAFLLAGVEIGNIEVKQCIYCGSKDDLTDEHSIPYGLWGQNTLIKGSCKICNVETSKFEQKILQDNLGRVREFFDGPTRHSKKRKKWTEQVKMLDQFGHQTNLPISEVPPIALFANFGYLPRKVSGEPKSIKHNKIDVIFRILFPGSSAASIGLFQPKLSINGNWWSRFVCKIAYGEYIRTIDREFRSPIISKFILTGKGDHSRFVGGRVGAPKIGYIYNVIHFGFVGSSGKILACSYVRLLSFMDSPSYLICLGEIPNQTQIPEKLKIIRNSDLGNIWPSYSAFAPVPQNLANLIDPQSSPTLPNP